VLPHQPNWEQQLPKVEPAQVSPVVPPQLPVVETVVPEPEPEPEPVPQVPKPDWHPVPQ